jgi:hypothetical protein
MLHAIKHSPSSFLRCDEQKIEEAKSKLEMKKTRKEMKMKAEKLKIELKMEAEKAKIEVKKKREIAEIEIRVAIAKDGIESAKCKREEESKEAEFRRTAALKAFEKCEKLDEMEAVAQNAIGYNNRQ